jgi:hypothetical protein
MTWVASLTFDAYADNAGILLFLDGLDEVASNDYDIAARAITPSRFLADSWRI